MHLQSENNQREAVFIANALALVLSVVEVSVRISFRCGYRL